MEIPFRIDFSGEGSKFTGTVFNGDLPVASTDGHFENGKLVVSFGHYLSKLEATVKDGQLEGKLSGRFKRDRYISSYPFHAKRYTPVALTTEKVPSIDGVWEIPYNSPKGEKSWHFIVRQKGPEVAAAILRVDGDTGTLTGAYKDGKFVVSHFSGSRPLVLEIKPSKNDTLEIVPERSLHHQGEADRLSPGRCSGQGAARAHRPRQAYPRQEPERGLQVQFPRRGWERRLQ